jgi:SAM-dependent methyltransferase
VKYVDRLSQASLRQQYPELDHQKIVAPDIIDNGEELSLIRNESLDFIIANHFIEHCADPVATITSFLAKLKPGGIVYLAVPDKRFTFDSRRESTSLAHLESDYQDCGSNSREQHYLDFARQALLKNGGNESQVAQLARQMMETNYSIHFHVWTQEEFLDFLHWLRQHHLHRLEILEVVRNQGEGIFILRKQATVTSESAST